MVGSLRMMCCLRSHAELANLGYQSVRYAAHYADDCGLLWLRLPWLIPV
jgi:hypothetical protein